MYKQMMSLEYCHVNSSLSWDHERNLTELALANKNTPKIIRAFSNYEIQKCIMVDDLRSETDSKSDFIKKIISELTIKPDVVYRESSFVFAASKLVEKVNPQVALSNEKKEELWLKKVRDHYGSITEFLVRWRKRDGTLAFSCPLLVATSYLYRLGALQKDENLSYLWGDGLMQANQLLNILPAMYMQVEANAQTIMSATYPEHASKINWHFFN